MGKCRIYLDSFGAWRMKWQTWRPTRHEFNLKITLLGMPPTMTFQNSHVRFYVSLIVSGEGRHTTHLLKCVRLQSTSLTRWRQPSDILSDISFDVLSDILSDISSDILSDISSDILSRGGGPAGNTERRWSRLRSGREHWAQQVAVEARQGTLAAWGSRLRCGREHWPRMIAVEVRQGTLNADGRGLCSAGPAENNGHVGSWLRADSAERKEGKKEETTDIKSNSPHLTGGEKETKETHARLLIISLLSLAMALRENGKEGGLRRFLPSSGFDKLHPDQIAILTNWIVKPSRQKEHRHTPLQKWTLWIK